MKIGTFTSSPARSSMPLRPLRLCQGDLPDVLPGLEVLALLGRVEGVDRDQIHVSTERRLAEDLDLHAARCSRAWMSARVQAKAYQGMCGKLPTGSPGLLPSGSDPAPSGLGVPHHGGPMAADAGAEPMRATANAARINENERLIRRVTVPSPGK